MSHMAILTNRTVVCDICRNPRRKVKPYRVGRPEGKQRSVVLCREDAAPIEAAIRVGQEVGGTEQARTSPIGRVWTMDEIEARRRTGE